jgi:hypothetical protein
MENTSFVHKYKHLSNINWGIFEKTIIKVHSNLKIIYIYDIVFVMRFCIKVDWIYSDYKFRELAYI